MIDLVAIQTKIYELLSTLNYPVYDAVPKDTKCPYVEIGYCDADDDSCKTNNGLDVLQYIDIYSDYKGQKEAKQIAQEVNDLMQNKTFNIDNATVFVYLKKMRIVKEYDNVINSTNVSSKVNYIHVILIYRILVKE